MGAICRVEPVVMSAGELEHEWAGTPGRLIRFYFMPHGRALLSCSFLCVYDTPSGSNKRWCVLLELLE